MKLGVENANTDSKKLLKSLSNPNPTMVEMVEACNRIGTVDHQFEAMAAGLQPCVAWKGQIPVLVVINLVI